MNPYLRVLLLGAAVSLIVNLKTARGEDVTSAYEAHVFKTEDGGSLPYRLLAPMEVKPDEKYPLLLFLHGAGERGNDNKAQLLHVAGELAEPQLRQRYPAFVVVPQCPAEQKWVDINWSDDSHTMPKDPSAPMNLVIGLLDTLQGSLPVDKSRIYVVGLSMGGYGTWDLLQRMPERFAAGIPICGGGDPAYSAEVAKVPVWAFHGDRDTAVKPRRSREMVAAIRQAGGNPIYTEYPGVAHNSWTMTAQNRLVWDWLFAQRKSQR